MKKDVVISLKGTNKYEGSGKDNIELTVGGNLFLKNGKHYLKYDQVENGEKVSTTLKIEENKVTVLRTGAMQSQMIVEKGKKHLSYYETPQGALTIGVYSNDVLVDINEDKGKLRLSYDIELNNTVASRNIVDINFKEV